MKTITLHWRSEPDNLSCSVVWQHRAAEYLPWETTKTDTGTTEIISTVTDADQPLMLGFMRVVATLQGFPLTPPELTGWAGLRPYTGGDSWRKQQGSYPAFVPKWGLTGGMLWTYWEVNWDEDWYLTSQWGRRFDVACRPPATYDDPAIDVDGDTTYETPFTISVRDGISIDLTAPTTHPDASFAGNNLFTYWLTSDGVYQSGLSYPIGDKQFAETIAITGAVNNNYLTTFYNWLRPSVGVSPGAAGPISVVFAASPDAKGNTSPLTTNKTLFYDENKTNYGTLSFNVIAPATNPSGYLWLYWTYAGEIYTSKDLEIELDSPDDWYGNYSLVATYEGRKGVGEVDMWVDKNGIAYDAETFDGALYFRRRTTSPATWDDAVLVDNSSSAGYSNPGIAGTIDGRILVNALDGDEVDINLAHKKFYSDDYGRTWTMG